MSLSSPRAFANKTPSPPTTQPHHDSDERDALARALARPQPPATPLAAANATNAATSPWSSSSPSLVFFSSPRCALCRSLAPDVQRAREAHGAWLSVVEVTADDRRAAWAPEMLAYGVETVPCFVLLSSPSTATAADSPSASAGKRGGQALVPAAPPIAIARSGRPRGRAHAQRSLAALVRLAEATTKTTTAG